MMTDITGSGSLRLVMGFCYSFIFLDGNKPSAAVLAFAQIPLLFPVADTTRNIKSNFKAGSITAMGAKPAWHAITPLSVELGQLCIRLNCPAVE